MRVATSSFVRFQGAELDLLREGVRLIRQSGEATIFDAAVRSLNADLNIVTEPLYDMPNTRRMRQAVIHLLGHSSERVSGIWRMHFDGLRKVVVQLDEQRDEDDADMCYKFDYRVSPYRNATVFDEGDMERVLQSVKRESEIWRAARFARKYRLNSLLKEVYEPAISSVVEKADFMTECAVRVFTRSMMEHVDVRTVMGHRERAWERTIKRYVELVSKMALLLGMDRVNMSLMHIVTEVFEGDREMASQALMGGEVYTKELLPWVLTQRLQGFYLPTYHGESVLQQLGYAVENFARTECDSRLGSSLEVIDYVDAEIDVRPEDRVAEHARLVLLQDLNRRAAILARRNENYKAMRTLNDAGRDAEQQIEELELSLVSTFTGDLTKTPPPQGKLLSA